MSSSLQVTSIGFQSASDTDAGKGLLGYITCVINNTLMLDGITFRRTSHGRLTLSYPTRRDRSGKQHAVIRPLNDEARQHLEREIFKALRLNLEESSP